MTQNFYHDGNNAVEPHMVRLSVVGITGMPENTDSWREEGEMSGQTFSATVRVTSLESGKVVGKTPPSQGKKTCTTTLAGRKPLVDVSNRGHEFGDKNKTKSSPKSSLTLSWDPPSTLLFVANIPAGSDECPSCYYELCVYLLVPEDSSENGRQREAQSSRRAVNGANRIRQNEQTKMKQVPYGSSILCVEPGKINSSDRNEERHTLPVSVFSFRTPADDSDGRTDVDKHEEEKMLVSASASASSARILVDVQVWPVSDKGGDDVSTVASTASSTISRSIQKNVPRSLGSLMSNKSLSPIRSGTGKKKRAVPMERLVDGFMNTFACGAKCGAKHPASGEDDDDSVGEWNGLRVKSEVKPNQGTANGRHPLVGSISKRFEKV